MRTYLPGTVSFFAEITGAYSCAQRRVRARRPLADGWARGGLQVLSRALLPHQYHPQYRPDYRIALVPHGCCHVLAFQAQMIRRHTLTAAYPAIISSPQPHMSPFDLDASESS